MSVSSFLVLAVIGLLSYVFALYKKRLSYWKSRGIAYEEPHWLMGNAHGLGSTRSFAAVWQDFYDKFKGTGPFAGFYMFQRPTAFLLDIGLIKNVLIKDFNNFTDRGFFSNPEDDPLSGQLFLIDGQKWRNIRNKLSPTFTSGKMKLMYPIVSAKGKELSKVMGEMASKNSVVEVGDVATRYTMDVIGDCAFGIDCNSLKDPTAQFRIMGKRATVETSGGKVGTVLRNGFPTLAKKLHCKMTHPEIEKYFMTIIRDAVDQREKCGVRRNDFLDMLIDLKNKKLVKNEHGEDLTNLTFDEIAGQAFVFLLAGFETSSTTMGYALYELARNPDIQQKAREEITDVFANNNGEFPYDALKDMQYLDQIISETLRMHTIVPVLNRQALEDYPVPGHSKYVIEKGTPVMIPIRAIHLDPDFYPNPTQFNPDRFTPEAVKNRDSVEWLPFGDGPRNCIGMRFGLMQTRLGLAYLLKDYEFSTCSKTEIPLKFSLKSFLVSPANGVQLKVTPVKK